MADMEYDLTIAKDLIPPTVRRWMYAILSLVGVAMTAVVAAYAAVGTTVPSWATVTLAVLGVLAGPFGFLAANNVSVNVAVPAEPDVDTDAEWS